MLEFDPEDKDDRFIVGDPSNDVLPYFFILIFVAIALALYFSPGPVSQPNPPVSKQECQK